MYVCTATDCATVADGNDGLRYNSVADMRCEHVCTTRIKTVDYTDTAVYWSGGELAMAGGTNYDSAAPGKTSYCSCGSTGVNGGVSF